MADKFPRLYNVTFIKNVKVDRVIASKGMCLVFRRTLWGKLVVEWKDLLEVIEKVKLREGEDRVMWKLGSFTVKTVYNALQTRLPIKNFKQHCGLSNYQPKLKSSFG